FKADDKHGAEPDEGHHIKIKKEKADGSDSGEEDIKKRVGGEEEDSENEKWKEKSGEKDEDKAESRGSEKGSAERNDKDREGATEKKAERRTSEDDERSEPGHEKAGFKEELKDLVRLAIHRHGAKSDEEDEEGGKKLAPSRTTIKPAIKKDMGRGKKQDPPVQISVQDPAKGTPVQKETGPAPAVADPAPPKGSKEPAASQVQGGQQGREQKKGARPAEPQKKPMVRKIKRGPAAPDDGSVVERRAPSAIDTEEREGPRIPADGMGAASTMVISGIAMLSGAGAAASISPAITIPKAAAMEGPASFIAKTLGALKTVFGEFLEDWAFALHTRLNLPFTPDRHREREQGSGRWRLFSELESKRYSFLNTETSLFEYLKMLLCALLLGVGFSLVQPPGAGAFMEIFPVALFAVGTAIFFHELAHDLTAGRHGVDTRFEIWPLGVVVMLLSISFGGLFAAFMNSEIKGRTEEHGVIYLAGPLTNFLLAVAFFGLSGLGGPMYLLGRFGAAVNITIAAYNMLPIKPVDGHYVFRWNKLWWTVLAIPSFVIAASALEGVVL
ncbi:MAG: hypothetical protein D6733_05235, partial [Methanobacteriota archaeon]